MKYDIDLEKIAAQIHEYYFAKYGGFLPAHYCDLPEYMKADNRAAARRIGNVLAIAGLRIAEREGGAWTEEDRKFIGAVMEENIEQLAEAEHDGWVETRLRQGWTLTSSPPANKAAKMANFDRRVHHLLIPYAKLPPQERQKDQDVRNYIEIIGQTDYRIVPKERA